MSTPSFLCFSSFSFAFDHNTYLWNTCVCLHAWLGATGLPRSPLRLSRLLQVARWQVKMMLPPAVPDILWTHLLGDVMSPG